MTSMKAEKPTGSSQTPPAGQAKEPAAAKAGTGAPKAQAPKLAPKKAETKPREPIKKAKVGKPAAKN